MGDDVRKVFMDVYKEKELKKLFPVMFLVSARFCLRYKDVADLLEKITYVQLNLSAPAQMWDSAFDDNFKEVMLNALRRCTVAREKELDDERAKLKITQIVIDTAISELLSSKMASATAAAPVAVTDDDADPPTTTKSVPKYLYHGTAADNKHNILSLGLLPMKRRYVYLYEDEEVAYKIGYRHGGATSIFRIDTKAFIAQGNKLSKEDLGYGEVWLADAVPAIFIIEADYLLSQ